MKEFHQAPLARLRVRNGEGGGGAGGRDWRSPELLNHPYQTARKKLKILFSVWTHSQHKYTHPSATYIAHMHANDINYSSHSCIASKTYILSNHYI